jgi:hypothetical protein
MAKLAEDTNQPETFLDAATEFWLDQLERHETLYGKDSPEYVKLSNLTAEHSKIMQNCEF